MQGGSGNNGASNLATDPSLWPDKHKFEKLDVKKEINKLNISK